MMDDSSSDDDGMPATATSASFQWQWQDDDGSFVDYDSKHNSMIEDEYQEYSNDPTSLSDGVVSLSVPGRVKKRKGGNYLIDFTNMTQTNTVSGYVRTVQRTGGSGIVWEWEDDLGGSSSRGRFRKGSKIRKKQFKQFDPTTSSLLEKEYLNGNSGCALDHGWYQKRGGYWVDFTSMKQTRTSSKFSRRIRRRTLATSSSPLIPPATPATSVPPPSLPIQHKQLDYIWEWEGESSGTWIPFSLQACKVLEGMSTRGHSRIPLKITMKETVEEQKGTGKKHVEKPEHDDTKEEESKQTERSVVVDLSAMNLKDNASGEISKVRRNPPLPSHPKRKGSRSELIASTDKVTFDQCDGKKVAEAEKVTEWKIVDLENFNPKDKCVICLCPLLMDGEEEEYQEMIGPGKSPKKRNRGHDPIEPVVALKRCVGHWFHMNCICTMFSDSFVCCPVCSIIYGIRVGPMPKGEMTVSRSPVSSTPIEHVDENMKSTTVGAIIIQYNFPSGIQTKSHPNPGKPYEGTSRTGYLPDNKAGLQLLGLLRLCWERGLSFQVGTSVTTGRSDCVVWNGVHHKTGTTGGPTSFGYPDPTYLSRVTEELADKGVLPSQLLPRHFSVP